ncbi:molybdopterin-dependent oxidoreductase-like protein [Streptomyces sp. SLBN-31]|nr:molybdopterin-dependent oxidoreductase-like protein [Streptomyces sp. SLBN-31]
MSENEKERRIRPGTVALGALSGALAGFAALAFAEAVAGLVRPQAGPVVAVGGAAIDRTPTPVKDWAIRHFGTDDKLVLQLGILAVLTLFALLLGIAAPRFRRTAALGVLLFGVVGAAAATSRPDSRGVADALPSVVGAVVGAVVLYVLAGRLAPRPPATTEREAAPGDRDRRGFVITATAAALASAGAGALGRSLGGAAGRDAVASRRAVMLPAPASPAAAVPRGAGLRIPGISPFTTPNGSFYRVDTALVVPKVDATAWRLRIHGKGVARPRKLTYDDLVRRELIERDITLTCVSNEVGGPYVGTPAGSAYAWPICWPSAGCARPPGAARPTSSWPARSTA